MYFLSIANLFLMSFYLQGSSNVPCSSFLTECFQLCSSPLYSFFQFIQPLKVLWFHSFVKEATQFYLFSFSSVFPPVPSQISGRDPLVVVECCNAPRPELQLPSRVPGFLCVFYFCLLLLCLHCIMSSCHHVINLCISTHLNKIVWIFGPFKSRDIHNGDLSL